MYLNDIQRADFYSTIGLDSRQFDCHVIRKTNQSSGTLFPVILDVDHPRFFPLLEKCSGNNQNLIDIDKEELPETLKTLKKIPVILNLVGNLLQLYFLPAIETKYIWTQNF
jgi:magnesium-protoporphyrin IX monomethyl ester (oxidative) cyclase